MTLVFWLVVVIYLGFYLNAQLPAIKAWWLTRDIRKDIRDMEKNNDV